MSFWKSIFGDSSKKSETDKANAGISPKFREWVVKSIKLIGTQGATMENEELYAFLIENGIPGEDAGEIIIFLPTAFCRKLLPEVNWPPTYVDYYAGGKEIKRKYKENERYVIMEEETNNYWKAHPSNDIILHVAGKSSEFNAINQMLNNGGKLENVMMSESYVGRNG